MSPTRRPRRPAATTVLAAELHEGDVILHRGTSAEPRRLVVGRVQVVTEGWSHDRPAIFVYEDGNHDKRLFYRSDTPVQVER